MAKLNSESSSSLERMSDSLPSEPQMMYDSAAYATTSSLTSNNPIKKTIRSNFPETWLFQIDISKYKNRNKLILNCKFILYFKKNKSEKGEIEKKTTAPDTITDWILDAYCLSKSKGLGISKTQTVRVFQSLFVSMDLPYSVIRGETFPVKASVFNYENTCLPVLNFSYSSQFNTFFNEKKIDFRYQSKFY